MMRLVELLVRCCCLPDRRDELTGDLCELFQHRARRWGPARARRRLVVDLASACMRQSRVRGWTAREWAVSGALLAVLLAGSAQAGGAAAPYRITATDAGGTFTLDLQQGAVLGAALNGAPLPPHRVRQLGSRVVLRGADQGRDLEIALTPRGGIRWESRRPLAPVQDTPIDLSLAQRYFAELAAASARDGGALWGVPLYGPMFFVDRATRFVVANEADSAGLLERRGGVFVGTLPPDQNPANTAILWSGKRWTMVVWPLSSDGYRRRRLEFHELFHRIQPDLRLEALDPAGAHLGTRDGRLWTRLEWRALAEALIRKDDERRQALEDALRFRSRRHALFPGAAAEERALELNEGLSEYTGLRLSGLPAWVRADRAAAGLMDRERQETLARSFAYASGPAYGVLLDERDDSWRAQVSPRTDLAELARRAYGLRLPDLAEAELLARARRYDGDQVAAEETALARRLAAQEAQLRQRLVDGPTVTLPVASRFRYSFDPGGATPLGDLGTTYESARVTDEWGILTVESGGVLLRRQAAGIVGVVVPAPPGATAPPLSGEGWRLELADGWGVRPAARAGSWEVKRGER